MLTMPRDTVASSPAPAHPGSARRRLPVIESFLLVFLMVLPLALPDYLMALGTRVLILSLLALSFDLVWGFAGIMSFGHAVFFGAAGYLAAVLSRDFGVAELLVAAPLAMLAGLVLSLLISGFLLLGRHPVTMVFVSLGTLTMAYAAERLARGMYFLGGQNGIPSIAAPTLSGAQIGEGPPLYYLALAVLLAAYAMCRWMVRSQFGLALVGMRESEGRMAFFGYRVPHMKALVFCASGALAGLAGCLYAFNEGFVGPGMLGVVTSTQIVLYVLLGGAGTLAGAVLGVIAIESASFWLADRYPQAWPVILGLLMLAVVLFRPAGLISLMVSSRERTGSFAPHLERRQDHGAA